MNISVRRQRVQIIFLKIKVKINLKQKYKFVHFIRHKMNAMSIGEKLLIDTNRIAIHFNDEFHFDLNQYNDNSSGFTRAFYAFKTIECYGSLIMFEYNDPSVFHIAEIIKGTIIKPLIFDFENEKVVYKTMKYVNKKTYDYSNYPLLAALRPPFTTICSRSENVANVIQSLFYGYEIPISYESLHPKMIEQLCEAFLRSEFSPPKIQLLTTLIKTGKTMPWVDIAGYTISGNIIYAQITFSSGIESLRKANDLVKFVKGNGIAILFSNDEEDLDIKGLDYHFKIKNVYNSFKNSNNSIYLKMLKAMVGLSVNM
jgi:hypothetical protein